MKITIHLVAFLASAIFLAGCGGEDATGDAKAIVAVGNTSPFDFESMTVQSTDGRVYYDGPFNCRQSNTNCDLNLSQEINESVTLLLKNASGQLVRAVIVADAPGPYIKFTPDAMSTGFYLMRRLANELKVSDGLDWVAVHDRVQTFFTLYDSPDGSLDPYEEIGDYYTSQIIKKSVDSEADFLASFKQRLLKWEVAQKEELPVPGTQYASLLQRVWAYFKAMDFSLIRNAYAQESSCSPGLQTFLTFTENLASVVPVVGDAISGAAGIGNSYCDDTGSKLDTIIAELNNLTNSINAVDRSVSALSAHIANTSINNKTLELEKIVTELSELNTNYKTILNPGRKLKDQPEYKSLKDYFTENGGWDKALDKGGATLKKILGAVHNNTDTSLYTRISNATTASNLASYVEALQLRCGVQPTSTTENFVKVRQQCNNIINANTARLVASQGVLLHIAKDIFDVFNAYPIPAFAAYGRHSDLTNADDTDYYGKAHQRLQSKFKDQQSTMLTSLKSTINAPHGYFNVYAGLHEKLLSSLARRQCMQDGVGRQTTPAIVGWYAQTAQEKDNYIVTHCKVGDATERIEARYYYKRQGTNDDNDVANVLGVPVAYEYVKSGKPLFNSDANVSREVLDGYGQYYFEAPSLVAAGEGNGEVISTGRNLVKKPGGLWWGSVNTPTWIVFKSKIKPENGDPPHLVAKVKLETIDRERAYWYTISHLTCVAEPCRVDPQSEQWLIFHDSLNKELRQTLDLRDTGKRYGIDSVLRLAPVNE